MVRLFSCFCLPSCMEVRAWLTVCWLERRQFFSWAAADCGDEAGLTVLTELAEFTSGVEGRGEEGPGDPGDAGSEILLPPPPPPPPLTGLDKLELRDEPAPNGALQRRKRHVTAYYEQLEMILSDVSFLPYGDKMATGSSSNWKDSQPDQMDCNEIWSRYAA